MSMNLKLTPTVLEGLVQIPPSKSDSQRAIVCAALANGVSTLRNIGTSNDESNMLKCIQQLGAKVHYVEEHVLEITGISEPNSEVHLNVGESGLAMRLLTLVCSTFNQRITIDGSGSLLNRSMDFFDQVLPQLNVKVTSNHGKAPIEVCGPISSGDVFLEKVLSSQYITGLLIALSRLDGDSFIHIKNPVSEPYIAMTIQTLKKFNVFVDKVEEGYFVKGGQKFTACDYEIESDWSSGSYWLLAAALGNNIRVKGLNLESKQADKAIMNVLLAVGCKFSIEEDCIMVQSGKLVPFTFDATNCPDLFPTLVVLAAKINGVSEIKGVHRLKDKESNRALALQDEYNKLGLHIEVKSDVMEIHGTGKLKKAHVTAHNDHRIAMSLAIASTFCEENLFLSETESVAKSYPSFWEAFEMLRK